MTSTASKTWAVTAFFNPARYRSKAINYRLFRRHLKVPLLTMALEFYGVPELVEGDADILVRLTEGDVLWQKERLFNAALRYLPPHCEQVLWLDCDVVFPSPDWLTQVSAALQQAPVVQPFSWVSHCRPDQLLSRLSQSKFCPEQRDETGVALLANQGLPTTQTRGEGSRCPLSRSSPGIAWATRRDFIEEVGFFDSMVIGSGDVAFWSGVSGDHGTFFGTARPPAVVDQWRRWQTKALACSQGQVGFVEGWVFNICHGDHAYRAYDTRWELLRQHDFDPAEDLRLSVQGTWLWNSDKPAMHQALRDYFVARREDDRQD